MIQTIIMTSDRPPNPLRGYIYFWEKYHNFPGQVNVVCGFTKPDFPMPDNFRFVSMGKQEDFPPTRWSERLHAVLADIADDVFMLMLDDYWITRRSDAVGTRMIYDYMHQFKNVIKFDLTTDRLYADGGGRYLYGYNQYDTLGYLDLIKSVPGTPYHLSLWGGMWRKELLDQFLIPGETAQQIELSGTQRLSLVGDEMLVLGTRQSPLRHINAIQGRGWNDDAMVGLPSIKRPDFEALKELGYDFG